MLAALQRKLYMDDETFDLFLTDLQKSRSVIAGSFPLVWACKPTPREWHPQTRTEVQTLSLVSRALGLALPMPALKIIGNWLQVVELVEDMKNDRMDIDIFYSSGFSFVLDWKSLPVDETGLYALNRQVHSVKLLEKGSTRLNLISVLCDPTLFVQDFDFSFCKATLQSQAIPMRGTVSPWNYFNSFFYIEHRIALALEYAVEGFTTPGFSALEFWYLLQRLVQEIRQRWQKYDRRRFTLSNLADLNELIARIESVPKPNSR